MLNPMHFASQAAGACALALAFLTPAQAVPRVDLSMSTSTTQVDLRVDARDFTDLYAYQFTLNFDPVALTGLSATEGSFLGGGGATYFSPGTLDGTAGAYTLTFGTLLGPVDGVDGSGRLASFSFGLRQGGATGGFRLSDVVLLDSTGAEISAEIGGPVTAVPEPSTLLLAAAGLVAIVGRRALKTRAA